MIRRWMVRPDPEWGIVSREEVREAFADGEALIERAGGVLTIVSRRAPTDFPGEMVTTGVVFEWKDRTDAKAQSEPHTGVVLREQAPEPALVDPEPEELEQALADADDADREALIAAHEERDGVKLDEEDLASIPVEMR